MSFASLSRLSSLSQVIAKQHQSSRLTLRLRPKLFSSKTSSPAMSAPSNTLDCLHWDNLALRSLPVDSNTANKVRQVRGACYSRVDPTPLDNPRLGCLSSSALSLLDLDVSQVSSDPQAPLYLSGNRVMPGSEPFAHCYCGHQFGVFAGQLGDGRAISLGEVINSKGERWELQLKGSGQTPYSRQADGRAVLRSSIREFLCSEHMHALRIPTTRAGSLVVSDSRVLRDPLYTGRAIMEPCAVVLRLSPTFWRFGSFEIFKPTDDYSGATGPSVGLEDEMLPKMLDFVIGTHFPHLSPDKFESPSDRYLAFFTEVMERTAKLVAQWQSVGFCHGVLNSDNLSILGVTIDYGPFGFLDLYDPNHICNHSDDRGRYAYRNQPKAVKFDLEKLSEALSPVVEEDKMEELVGRFDGLVQQHLYDIMRQKLGLLVESEDDKQLVDSLLAVMEHTGADWTNTFRRLSKISPLGGPSAVSDAVSLLASGCYSSSVLARKAEPQIPVRQLRSLLGIAQQQPAMLQVFGVTMDFLNEQVQKMERSQELRSMTPEAKQEADKSKWESWIQSFRRRVAQDVIAKLKLDLSPEQLQFAFGTDSSSASSAPSPNSPDPASSPLSKELQEAVKRTLTDRVSSMNSVNPKFILRNHLADYAIAKATGGDFGEVQRLLDVLTTPFDEREDMAEFKYDDIAPEPAFDICVSCSS
eukprot:GILI01018458.1.p1 GENE.GILI01018458.1~~GILI01018458.1.p1  ORF type:complete len:696 (-),score=147.99 GILI01018458.1:178-2265(-)